jgi:hypothetical protein
MAQTSTRKKSSASGGTRGRSSGSTRASASSRGSNSTRKRQGKRPSTKSSSNRPTDAVQQIGSKGKDAVAEGARSSGKAISSAAGKVKLPAVAGGAALAGLAGGLALAAKRNSPRKVLGMRVGNSAGKAGKDLAEASKNFGKISENLGQFATEVRKTREAIENGSKHSSPIEVVLRALTARR